MVQTLGGLLFCDSASCTQTVAACRDAPFALRSGLASNRAFVVGLGPSPRPSSLPFLRNGRDWPSHHLPCSGSWFRRQCRSKRPTWASKNSDSEKGEEGLKEEEEGSEKKEEGEARSGWDGTVVIQDDLDALLQVLNEDLRDNLRKHPRRADLLEVVLDLGRRPEARFLGDSGVEFLRTEEVTREDLEAAQAAVGEFGGDNRAGIEGTLHRISAIRSRKGTVIGLTCRVGRAVTGHADMARDLLRLGQSILFLGRPGVGKTTVIREIARVLAAELQKRVVIVDTSNEIGGDGDVPHPAIGAARRMQVPDPSMQHRVMIEAVENHMPEVVIVDEIGTEAEVLACRTIAERGVMLVGTAHGQILENIIKNPTLCDLVGGVQTVTLGDDEARARGTQKSVLERKTPPTFPLLIEMRERSHWVAHQTDRSVDALLHGRKPTVEVRTRDAKFKLLIERRTYDNYRGNRMDGGDYDNSNAPTAFSMLNGFGLIPDDFPEDYAWASKLGHIPNKDAVIDRAISATQTGKQFSWEDYEDDVYGYESSGSSGKRGSKRGARGVRPRIP